MSVNSLAASSEALRAATLSFNQKSLPPKSPSSALTAATKAAQVRSSVRPRPGEIGSSIALERGVAKRRQENTTSPMPLDPSMVAATLAASRHSTSPGKALEREEVVSVRARRKHFQEELFQEPGRGEGGGGGLYKISPERSRMNTPDPAVDSSNIDDISSLKSLFEKSSNTSNPVIHAPKPVRGIENASLTAAILATQLSPSTCASTQSSRRGSPVHKAPNRASPSRGDAVGKLSPLDIVPRLSLPPLSRGSTVSSVSRESDRPRSSTENGKADALLAATLASSPKPPDRLGPPQPPPSRRKEIKKKPQVVVREISYEPEDTSDTDSDSGSRYGTARTSMSINASKANASAISLPQLFTPPGPPPLPQRPSIPQLKPEDGPALKAAQMPPRAYSAFTSPSRQSPTRPSPIPRHRTGDSVLAASLAPSRVVSPSPRKPPAPPAPRRRRSLPPPPKGLRETMRKPRTPPKEPSPHRRNPHLVRHPHKHSKGEGKRWRHFVTEDERKRYDGLWAANKGLLLPTSAPPPPPPRGRATARNFEDEQHEWSSAPTYAEPLSDCVDSLIVRDIWQRSRLPDHQLAEIWELVGREGKARLSRDEFVVGTWLVDQCLKGRKLPAKVQDEVWESVRRLGVKGRK
ncbi:hypothetical protein B9Z19DRAFT_1088064 [Tuber borchii]|uniref:EH domain-containing protein n=1 Tax=Tuber borchii TaxID=42251 RepID=A0A2T6ZM36_TUBBO|nr:hypothetical protein B9Z19DRAFT_1088064 [Tuber borchii]